MGLASASAAAPDCAQPHAHQAAECDIRFAHGIGGCPHRDGNLCVAYNTADESPSDPFKSGDLERATTDRAPLSHALAYSEAHNIQHSYANPERS